MPEILIDNALSWLMFAIAGVVAGAINTLAGSGSLITLPIFMFLCGLPANIANGTNRVGVIFQSAIGLRSDQKAGAVEYTGSRWIIAATV